MKTKKIIAVIGSTGTQGGSLVRSILNDAESGFTPRAITRNDNSDKAQELKQLGVEVVEADMDDPESLIRAFTGVYGAYGVTSFWEHFSPEKELTQAKNIAQAASKANLKHMIWSTLEDTRKWVPLSDDRMPTLQGKYKVPHFDAKGEANQFFTKLNVPTTFLHTSFYWDNLIYFGMGPKKGENGEIFLHLPLGDKKLSGIAAEDIGKCAFGIFKAGEKYIGTEVGIAGGHLTGEKLADDLSKALGKNIKYNAVPFDVYRSFDFPGADDLGNMFQVKHDFQEQYVSTRSIDESKSLNSDLLSFDQWAEKYKDAIPLE